MSRLHEVGGKYKGWEEENAMAKMAGKRGCSAGGAGTRHDGSGPALVRYLKVGTSGVRPLGLRYP